MSSTPTVSALDRAVSTVVRDCLTVGAREDVLVVADPHTRALGEALARASAEAGGDAVFALMEPRETDGAEPPPPVAAALAAADVFIAPTSRSLSHTQARKRASEAGARGATMPGVTEDMLARVMDVDFDRLRARCRAVAALLDQADDAHLTCARGSDLRFELSGREGIADDGDLSAPGAFGNLPCGEGFIAPLAGEGTLATASLATVGLAAEPAVLRVDEGQLVDASGPEGQRFIARLREHGPAGTNLAELGIGTNDRATLTGNVLEDEKILGTVHVAFGASAGIGGTVAVPIHLDCVVVGPTLEVGGTLVLERGRFALA